MAGIIRRGEGSGMKKGLSQEGLKILACVTMLVDHAALLFGGSPWLRVIGRLAFPIYCFLLVVQMWLSFRP